MAAVPLPLHLLRPVSANRGGLMIGIFSLRTAGLPSGLDCNEHFPVMMGLLMQDKDGNVTLLRCTPVAPF